MAATLVKSCLNPKLLVPVLKQSGSSWLVCERLRHQYMEFYKDRLPKHREARSPEYIDKTDGMWKAYTRSNFWEKNRRRTDKDVFEGDVVNDILKSMELEYRTKNDMPFENLPNPYVKAPKKCILCQYNVEIDYKNTQLLSQFVSPYTGRLYGRNITGLCIHMQKRISKMVKRSRFLGFMPAMYKKSEYLNDPQLYDPFSRKKEHHEE